MTWKEIKLITLQKMFAAEGSNIPTDESTEDYLAGMPGAANEALQMLCTAGRYILKKVEIAHYPSRNLLGDFGNFIHGIEDGKISFETDGAHAYYFDFYGEGTLKISVGDSEAVNTEISSRKMFSPFSGRLENPENKKVVVEILSEYKGAIKMQRCTPTDFLKMKRFFRILRASHTIC